MKLEDVDTFEKLKAQLDSLHQEISVLAKKSPNDAVNAFKLKFVNATLRNYDAFFGKDYRPFADFEGFSTDELPSNSDVTFIVSQYIEFAEKFRADNIWLIYKTWYWNIPGHSNEVPTSPPRKLLNK